MYAIYLKIKQSIFQLEKACWIIIAIGLSVALPTKAVEQNTNDSNDKRRHMLEWEQYQQKLVLEELARSGEKRMNLFTALEGANSSYADETTSRLPVANNYTESVAVGDADGDGDLDILIANTPYKDSQGEQIPGSGQNRLLINNSTGKFVDETTNRLPVDDFYSWDVAFGDVDNDHDLDIYVTNWLGEADRLLINNGSGVFSDETTSRLPDETSDRSSGSDAEFADLDGDKDLDIVIVSYSGRDRLLINDGFGKFSDETDTDLSLDSGNSMGLDLGDVDNDGDLDVVIANQGSGEQNRLLINNGTGSFLDETSLRLPTLLDSSHGVILVDVDGDQDLDIFIANTSEESRLFINDGTGKYSDETANRLPVGIDFNKDVAAGDVDNDGDLDLFVADVAQDELLINDGVGIYTVGGFPAEDDIGSDTELADINSDGNLDLVVANIVQGDNNPQNRLYINTHAPLFLPVNPQHTMVEADPETVLADGTSIATITVTPKDSMGNNLGKGQRIVLKSSAGTLLETALDNGDGTYTQKLQASSSPGTAVITTFINGVKTTQSTQVVFAE